MWDNYAVCNAAKLEVSL